MALDQPVEAAAALAEGIQMLLPEVREVSGGAFGIVRCVSSGVHEGG